MSILEFNSIVMEQMRIGLIKPDELREGLMTALLEVDPDIRQTVINKIWRDDFKYLTPVWANSKKGEPACMK